MNRPLVSIFGCFAGLLLVLALPLHAEVIKIYGSDQFPPVSYLKNGMPAGVFPTILSRLEKETGDRYDVELVPWARAIWMAQRGRGAVANISWTAERTKQFDYSVPIYPAEVVLVVRKGREFPFESLDDLKGKVIGVGLSSSYRDEVDAAVARGDILIDPDPNQFNRMRKLLSGRTDGSFFGAGWIGVKWMIESTPEFRDRIDDFVVLPKVVAVDPLHLAIPKSMNKTEALQRLNRAYTKLKERGELADLLPR